MTTIRTAFDARSTADDVVRGLDLTGRRAVVTGADGGVGTEVTRSLARAGAEVTLAVRSTENGEATAEDIRRDTGSRSLRVAELDLADQGSVAAFVTSWHGPLDLLVNNAGVMAIPELTRTIEGWETQYAINHLGHFALALGLHRHLADAPGARVVAVSSSGHHVCPVDLADTHFRRREYDPWAAYGQSKTAVSLFAVEASRRWADDDIVVNAVMPGGIMTDLQRHLPRSTRDEWAKIPTNKTPQQGAATTLVAAVAPEYEGIGGRYLEDGNDAPLLEDDAASDGVHGVRRWAVDPLTARQVWDHSEDELRQAEALRSRP